MDEQVRLYVENSQSFILAVDWDEPFIVALIGFHVCWFLLLLGFRKNHVAMVSAFFLQSMSGGLLAFNCS